MSRGGNTRQRAAQARPQGPRPSAPAPPRTLRELIRSRALLGGLVALLAIGCAALGALVANGTFGDSTQYLSITSCTVGSAGCEARGPANLHADFALFIDGKEVDLTQPQFAPGAGADATIDPGGKTITIHRQLTTWDSFFRSIGIQLTDPTLPGGTTETTCMVMPGGTKYCNDKTNSFKFFVNGVQVDGIVNTDIDDLDRVLVSYGPESVAQVKSAQLPRLTANSCKADGRCAS